MLNGISEDGDEVVPVEDLVPEDFDDCCSIGYQDTLDRFQLKDLISSEKYDDVKSLCTSISSLWTQAHDKSLVHDWLVTNVQPVRYQRWLEVVPEAAGPDNTIKTTLPFREMLRFVRNLIHAGKTQQDQELLESIARSALAERRGAGVSVEEVRDQATEIKLTGRGAAALVIARLLKEFPDLRRHVEHLKSEGDDWNDKDQWAEILEKVKEGKEIHGRSSQDELLNIAVMAKHVDAVAALLEHPFVDPCWTDEHKWSARDWIDDALLHNEKELNGTKITKAEYRDLDVLLPRGQWSEGAVAHAYGSETSSSDSGIKLVKKSPHKYQIECLKEFEKQNVILNLKTGMGKTLCATMAVGMSRKNLPDKKVMFVVKSLVLVQQQARNISQDAYDFVKCAQIAGGTTSGWDKEAWEKCLRRNHVLVGIDVVFQQALDAGYLDLSQFSLVVFDECHHTVGKSAMAQICKKLQISRQGRASELPRVMGLTASFQVGTVDETNIATKREEIEGLMQAKLFCPKSVPDALTAGEEEIVRVSFNREDIREEQLKYINEIVEQRLLTPFCDAFPEIKVRKREKAISGSTHVFSETGLRGLHLHLQNQIIPQLEGWLQEANYRLGHARRDGASSAEIEECEARVERYKEALPRMKKYLKQAVGEFLAGSDFMQIAAVQISQKMLKLFEILNKQVKEEKRKGIVFVKRVIMVSPVRDLIASKLEIPAGMIAGGGAMRSDTDREKAVEDFRSGAIKVLVATNAIEEGFDVQDCGFVIRFEKFDVTKSHIQGKGRARMHDAKIFYFENDPEVEERRRRILEACAGGDEFGLGPDELENEHANIREIAGVYPLKQGSGQIDLLNCVQIAHQYVQEVLGKSVSSGLLIYRDDRMLGQLYAEGRSSLGDCKMGERVYSLPELLYVGMQAAGLDSGIKWSLRSRDVSASSSGGPPGKPPLQPMGVRLPTPDGWLEILEGSYFVKNVDMN